MGGGGKPPHFALTEVVGGWKGGQSRQNAEDASGAWCPGGVGMEVGKGQQAQAREARTRDLDPHSKTDGREPGEELLVLL